MRWFVWLSIGCVGAPEGLRATPEGSGPEIRVDFDAEPLPDIPFPNDLATRPDVSSPTGKRLNLPLNAELKIERHSREGLNRSTGFGVYAPISVGFGARLDLADLFARHPDDLHLPDAFDDDAVLVINVTPDSPDYGKAVHLDLGQGRFPQQLTRSFYLFDNDPHSGPSLLFDTVDEDHNGDGRLSLGEDTDGDGVLDVPNVWPPGGDRFYDLMTAYELSSDTLIVRPVVPLAEATTYAVVLTNRLVGLDGQPVRSPWAWVNHTRQTPDLEPLLEHLPTYGLSVDDVAFAWSFTTGTPTRDLHLLVEGLYEGTGPFAHMQATYVPDITEASTLHTLDGIPGTFLPAAELVVPFQNIGIIPDESLEIMGGAYNSFTAGFVGGSFESPYLLVDKDGDGGDGDESFAIDPLTGTVVAKSQRLVFSCAIPKASGNIQPSETGSPWPISIHGHGLGSTRIEFIAFAWALNRVGIAACAIDAPGHGLSLGDDENQVAAAFLGVTETAPLWWHLVDARFRDLTNDGLADAAADQFTADVLHTRDMLRQPVVDWAQFMRALEGCGTGTMHEYQMDQGERIDRGNDLLRCDWDDDGKVDLGGPGTRFFYDGVSMGGVEGGIAAAVLPNLEAAVLTVPGGGLFDVGLRTDIGDVGDGLTGRALTPLVGATPDGAGNVQLYQQVISWNDDETRVFATLPELPIGARIVVHNDSLGISNELRVSSEQRWRLPMKANVPDSAEKALLAGIPEGGIEEDVVYSVPDNIGLGDRIRVEIRAASGELIDEVSTFREYVWFEGVTYPVGSPLVALSWGLGLHRGSREIRQIVGVLGMAAEPGDPIAYAHQWSKEPVQAEATEVFIALTVGDTSVPEASGIALARAAGIVDYLSVDPRYGTSVDRYLIDKGVMQGQQEFGPYIGNDGSAVHYDPDDLDNGINPYGEPTDAAPLRLVVPTDEGVNALRFLYVTPWGSHAYFVPDQSLLFDVHTFGAQQMAHFLSTAGAEISDDPCLATPNCDFLRYLEPL